MNDLSASAARYETGYGYHRIMDTPWETTVPRVREALAAEGFGVLCEIDISAKLREKLGIDFYRYLILGACNPPLAYQALQEEPDLGLLLPCNVIVYEREGKTVIAAIDAARMLSIVDNPRLEAVAGQVNEKLRRVIDSV
ncbi:MAG: DUF302 domain-containing protein [Blastocatellia bacterium]